MLCVLAGRALPTNDVNADSSGEQHSLEVIPEMKATPRSPERKQGRRHFDLLTAGTLLIALYGAALSTVVLLRDLDADERRFVLAVERRLTPQCPQADALRIRVTNPGKRPVTIINVEFLSADQRLVGARRGKLVKRRGRLDLVQVPQEAELPTTLRDGQTELFTFVMDDLLRAMPRPVMAVVTDSEYHQQAISVRWALSKTRDGRKAFRQIMQEQGLGPLHTCQLAL